MQQTAMQAGDTDLNLRALRQQDAVEFTRLVKAHESVLLGLCQSMGLQYADAQDATIEAFAAVYRALPTFRGDARLSTWLYRIAYRSILRVRKRNRRWLSAATANAPAQAAENRIDSSASKGLEQDENARQLWQAVAQLRPQEAAVVELFYRLGWSVAEVAENLGYSVSQVKILLFRARGALAEKLVKMGVTP